MTERRPRWPLFAGLAAVALAVLVATPFALRAFFGNEPSPVDAGAVTWTAYRSDAVGWALDLPDVFSVREWDDGDVAIRHEGHTVARVVWLSEEEADDRGLWPGRGEVTEATLGGRPAERHAYSHWDGPFREPTVAYVVPHRGKLLALEIRGDEEPDEVKRRIVESFRFVPDEDGL